MATRHGRVDLVLVKRCGTCIRVIKLPSIRGCIIQLLRVNAEHVLNFLKSIRALVAS